MSLDGDRMELPEMEGKATLVPPSPYSIAPLGYDLRPAAPAAKRSAVAGAFGAGSVFGGLIVAAVVLAWQAAHPPAESAAAALAAHPPVMVAAAAPPPQPISVPSAATTPAAAAGSPDTAAASAPTPASPATAEAANGSAKRGKVAPRRYVTHKASQARSSSGGSNLGSSGNDDAFMKAIRASSH